MQLMRELLRLIARFLWQRYASGGADTAASGSNTEHNHGEAED